MSADGLLARALPSAPEVVGERPRILFVAENVSLAQVVRLRVLAGSLDPQRYEVVFACSDFDPLIFDGTGFARRTIHSMSAAQMHRPWPLGRTALTVEAPRRLRARRPEPALVRTDRRLVVGDLRCPGLVAAPKLGVPHALCQCPIGARTPSAKPSATLHPTSHDRPHRVAPHVGYKAMPWLLDHFASPITALRRRYGLPVIGNLLDVLTSADHTLFPDVPELTPLTRQARRHSATQHFLGPVLWSPDVPLPRELDAEPSSMPLVYVTLGSSGDVRLIDALLAALSRLPVRVLLTTAGRFDRSSLPPNVVLAL